jgi:hypothetical protein
MLLLCYDLIKNLRSINEHLLQFFGPAMQECALVDESVDGEAECRVRTGHSPTLPTGEEDKDVQVDNALSMSAIYRRRQRCQPQRQAYVDTLHKVHRVQLVGSRWDDETEFFVI